MFMLGGCTTFLGRISGRCIALGKRSLANEDTTFYVSLLFVYYARNLLSQVLPVTLSHIHIFLILNENLVYAFRNFYVTRLNLIISELEAVL